MLPSIVMVLGRTYFWENRILYSLKAAFEEQDNHLSFDAVVKVRVMDLYRYLIGMVWAIICLVSINTQHA